MTEEGRKKDGRRTRGRVGNGGWRVESGEWEVESAEWGVRGRGIRAKRDTSREERGENILVH